MIMWLDFWLFGNGRGLKSPFSDDRFYWLVDKYQKERNEKNGQLYTFSHGFGAQLTSFQWTHPNAGEERLLAGYSFRPLHSIRIGPRVKVSWKCMDLPKDLDGLNDKIREIEKSLGNNYA